MNKGTNYRKGKKNEILKLLHMCGALPYKGVHYLDGSPRLTMRRIREMEQAGIVEVYPRGKTKKAGVSREVIETPIHFYLKNYREKNKEYSEYLPVGYKEHYVYIASKYTTFCKTDKERRDRILKNADVYMMMYGAGIRTLNEDKECLAKTNCLINLDEGYYYTSREIKESLGYELGKSNNEVKHTRIMGCYMSPGGIYGVYNIGERLIEWSRYGELKMKGYLERVIRVKIKTQEPFETIDGAILAVKDMLFCEKIINNEYAEDKRAREGRIYLNIDYAYKQLYGVPSNVIGQKILKIMGVQNWKAKMHRMIIKEDERKENGKHYSINCDGYKDGVYVLMFCDGDLVKLKQYIKRAELEEDKTKFKIYCFDYQVPLIVKIGGYSSEIFKVDFELFYERFMEVERSTFG